MQHCWPGPPILHSGGLTFPRSFILKSPVVLTVNGKAEAVLMDAGEYEKITGALNLLKLLIPAEEDIRSGRHAEAAAFFKEFKRARNI